MTKEHDTHAVQLPDDAMLSLDRQLCFAIYSAAHAFNRTYKPLLDPYGLTYPQYLVLLSLWQDDGKTVKALGDALHLDSGTLSPLLARLSDRSYLETRWEADPPPGRPRRHLYRLTADGAQRAAEVARPASSPTPTRVRPVLGGA